MKERNHRNKAVNINWPSSKCHIPVTIWLGFFKTFALNTFRNHKMSVSIFINNSYIDREN